MRRCAPEGRRTIAEELGSIAEIDDEKVDGKDEDDEEEEEEEEEDSSDSSFFSLSGTPLLTTTAAAPAALASCPPFPGKISTL